MPSLCRAVSQLERDLAAAAYEHSRSEGKWANERSALALQLRRKDEDVQELGLELERSRGAVAEWAAALEDKDGKDGQLERLNVLLGLRDFELTQTQEELGNEKVRPRVATIQGVLHSEGVPGWCLPAEPPPAAHDPVASCILRPVSRVPQERFQLLSTAHNDAVAAVAEHEAAVDQLEAVRRVLVIPPVCT